MANQNAATLRLMSDLREMWKDAPEVSAAGMATTSQRWAPIFDLTCNRHDALGRWSADVLFCVFGREQVQDR